jgi:monofunctional biosynthetic peptidoglycan transglycosylase
VKRTLAIALVLLLLLPAATSVALVAALRWVDPPVSAFMLRKGGRFEWNRFVAAEHISPHLAIAVVAAEDQRFPEHHGFDVDSILDALIDHLRGRRTRGASTISQQVAKNLFLWPERSFVRKALEAWLTVWIELLWSKQRILEVYLNVAEFGPGVFGAAAASEAFFGVRAGELDPTQAALLAAVLPNPSRLRAAEPSPYVLARRGWILAQMEMLGGPQYLRH